MHWPCVTRFSSLPPSGKLLHNPTTELLLLSTFSLMVETGNEWKEKMTDDWKGGHSPVSSTGRGTYRESLEFKPILPMNLPPHNSKLCIQPSPLIEKRSFLLSKITFFNYNHTFTPKTTALEPKCIKPKYIGNIKTMYSSKSLPTETLGVCSNSWNPTLWKQGINFNYLRFFTLLCAFWD